MPRQPPSFMEWVAGTNYKKKSHRSHNKHKHRNDSGLRHVCSFDVLTDDESSTDMYRIAVPRGESARTHRSRATPMPIRPALRQPLSGSSDSLEANTFIRHPDAHRRTHRSNTHATLPRVDFTQADVEQHASDPDCPCDICADEIRKQQERVNAQARERHREATPSPEPEEEGECLCDICLGEQRKLHKKRVSFADTSPEESDTKGSAVRVSHGSGKGKKGHAVAISVSSADEAESEESNTHARVEAKKKNGSVSVAVAMSSGEESESEASIVDAKPKANSGKKLGGIIKKKSAIATPESTDAKSESSAASTKNKKANTAKSKKSTNKGKKQKKDETESAESTEDDDEELDETEEEDETTEEEVQAKSTKKGKQKNKSTDKKAKANKKPEQKQKSAKKKKKPVSESETVSETESEDESVVESEVEKHKKAKTKSKSKKQEQKAPEPVTSYPPANAPPYLRQPNTLLPPRTSVMQVEHAVEVPEDPRPNAFFDNDSGTARVYHGPAYGNPSGMLYPKRVYDYQNIPVGTPYPQQNPWYYGFPPTAGQAVPPNMPPPMPPNVPPNMPPYMQPPPGTSAADAANPWFRGYGTVGPAPTNNDQKHNGGHYNQSPPKSRGSRDRDTGWESNVMPGPPSGSPANGSNASQGSKGWGSSGRQWDAQGVPGSSWAPEKETEKKKSKSKRDKEGEAVEASFKDKIGLLGKALRDAAARDKADLRARSERWSNRSGSSKDRSPLPDNSSWNNNSNNNNNNNNDSGWGNGNANNGSNNGSNSGWANNNNNDGWANSGNNDWNNNNTSNNNDNGGWNNNNNSGWGDNNNANDNSGWNTAGPSNANNNDNEWGNSGGWGTGGNANNDSGWGNNNADNSNNNANNGDNGWGNDKNTTTSPPMPGTWGSPVPSHSSNRPASNWSGGNVGGGGNMSSTPPISANNGKKDKGKGKAVESGPNWGDTTLAQSSGGYWETAEGKADLAQGISGGSGGGGPSKNDKVNNANVSWW